MTITSTSQAASVLPRSAQIAVAALSNQPKYGLISEVAREFGSSRGRVYRCRDKGAEALREAFAMDDPEMTASEPMVWPAGVREADVRRFIVAARVEGINSIRSIERLVVHAFGVEHSYRYVRDTLEEAYKRAAEFNASVDLANVHAVAADELFSQGQPVLGCIDLKSQYVVLLKESAKRDEAAWSEAISSQKNRNFAPKVVVKDAGTAMTAAFNATLPNTEQRDDCFHAQMNMTEVRVWLERRAYKMIAHEYEVEAKYISGNFAGPSAVQYGKLKRVSDDREHSVELFDSFDALCRRATIAMAFCSPDAPVLRTGEEITTDLQNIAQQMHNLDHPKITKVARYLDARAQGLGLYADGLRQQFLALAPQVGGGSIIELVVWFWHLRALCRLTTNIPSLRRQQHANAVHALSLVYLECGSNLSVMHKRLEQIFAVIEGRYRASSLIENLNSIIRPYLVVHKTVDQGFLELFRAWRNLRKPKWWGKHKGISAYELLTGQTVGDDWLTVLGYPESSSN